MDGNEYDEDYDGTILNTEARNIWLSIHINYVLGHSTAVQRKKKAEAGQKMELSSSKI